MQGWREPLTLENFFVIPDSFASGFVFSCFETGWAGVLSKLALDKPRQQELLDKARAGESAYPILMQMGWLFWRRMLACMTLTLIYAATSFVGPGLLNRIVNFLDKPSSEQTSQEVTQIYGCVLGLFLAQIIGSLFNGMANRIAIGTQIMVRSELNVAVCEKAMRLSHRYASAGVQRGCVHVRALRLAESCQVPF